MATETQEIIQRESPDIEAYKLGLMEQAKQLTSAPPTGGLPGITSQGMTSAQQQALSAAQSGLSSYMPYLQSGQATMNMAGGQYLAGTGAPSAAQMQQYMNPYQQAVQAEIQRAYAPQFQQVAGQAVGAGAFGGGRAAIQQAEVGRNMADAMAKAQAQNFLQAQQAAQNEMQRSLAAGQGLSQLGMQQAGLGELQSRLGQSGIAQLAQLGEQERNILQAQDEAARQTQMQQIYEPYQRLGFLSDIYKGAPSSQMTTSIQAAPQPGLLNQLLGAGIGGLSLYGAAQKAFG